MQETYGWLYQALTHLLAEADLMGLIQHGAPEDEYDIEARYILQHLSAATSPESTGQLIFQTFTQAFGSAFSSANYQSLPDAGKRYYAALGEKARALIRRWQTEAGHPTSL